MRAIHTVSKAYEYQYVGDWSTLLADIRTPVTEKPRL